MRTTNDWQCPECSTIEERITIEGQPPDSCSNCGVTYGHGIEPTKLLKASKFKLDAISGDFPSATAQFDRVHRQAAKVESNRSYYEH
jgi:hypothetical protein